MNGFCVGTHRFRELVNCLPDADAANRLLHVDRCDILDVRRGFDRDAVRFAEEIFEQATFDLDAVFVPPMPGMQFYISCRDALGIGQGHFALTDDLAVFLQDPVDDVRIGGNDAEPQGAL